MLTIKKLSASISDTPILKDFSLEIPDQHILALMGPNGSGKSTLANIMAGHPAYQIESGSIEWQAENLLDMSPEERAARGIFLAFQYPPSIPGVAISQFLRVAKNAQEKARQEPVTNVTAFIKELRVALKQLSIPTTFAERPVNEGFSGGEKKRLEMLQMLILKPKLIILDEIDSGLDIDAIQVVAKAVNFLHEQGSSVLVITHYQRLLNFIQPDSVHIMKDGHIVQSGEANLAFELEAKGYTNL